MGFVLGFLFFVFFVFCFCFVLFPLSYFSFQPVLHDWCNESKRQCTCVSIKYAKSSKGAGRSSEVERSLMVRWIFGSILHGVDQPVLHDWCNKGHGMCYPVCGMVHIKEPLLLIDKSSLCGGSGFPFSPSEWSLTICLTPYNRR